MLNPCHLLFHLEQQSLSREELEVFTFKMFEKCIDVSVLVDEEDLAVAEAANRPLGVRVDAKDRNGAIRHHACCLEECAITSKRDNEVYLHWVDVLTCQLVATLRFDVTATLFE